MAAGAKRRIDWEGWFGLPGIADLPGGRLPHLFLVAPGSVLFRLRAKNSSGEGQTPLPAGSKMSGALRRDELPRALRAGGLGSRNSGGPAGDDEDAAAFAGGMLALDLQAR